MDFDKSAYSTLFWAHNKKKIMQISQETSEIFTLEVLAMLIPPHLNVSQCLFKGSKKCKNLRHFYFFVKDWIGMRSILK